MSRSYNMLVRIRNVAPERVDRVKQAANDEWDFDDWHEYEDSISACVDGYLCSGETEDEFAERLAKVIWAANGGYCNVEVVATYLENLPCETHSFDEDQYAQIQSAADKPIETQEGRNNG
ncbi:MAG: hypothetical protein HQ567_06960 [Candidatus Nealsonbacteria bacterium]|nr:hypothetical protein [Candidatus Nealsonbacteria bacterium]